MKEEVINYLGRERVGVFAIELPDGTPHASTVHFACTAEPFSILIGMGAGSIKGKALVDANMLKASFVVGFSEEEMQTFQADGKITVVAEDLAQFDEVYLGKFPEKAERAVAPTFVRAVFTPKWWRFSDMKNKKVLTSEDA